MARTLFHLTLLGVLMTTPSADARLPLKVALVRLPEWTDAQVEPFRSLLDGQDLAFDVLDTVSVEALEPYDLVVVPGWKDEDHTFYYALKVAFYRGGRILGCAWGDDFWAKGLISRMSLLKFSGFRDWAPSLMAWIGSGCTSIMRPSAPAATAARDMGAT
jgi:hypothetical protein